MASNVSNATSCGPRVAARCRRCRRQPPGAVASQFLDRIFRPLHRLVRKRAGMFQPAQCFQQAGLKKRRHHHRHLNTGRAQFVHQGFADRDHRSRGGFDQRNAGERVALRRHSSLGRDADIFSIFAVGNIARTGTCPHVCAQGHAKVGISVEEVARDCSGSSRRQHLHRAAARGPHAVALETLDAAALPRQGQRARAAALCGQ